MVSWLLGTGRTNVTVASSSKAALTPGDGEYMADMMDRISKHFARLPSETELFEQNAQKLANLKSHLQDARDIQRALTSLSSVLKTTIPTLDNQFSELFVREHYAKLPDEIFAIIFEFASVDDFRTTKCISHVCRRFRHLTLPISRLWTTICPNARCQLIDAITIAERSQRDDSKLTLQLTSSNIRPWSGGDIAYTVSLMDFVGLHSSRIRDLTLDLTILRGDMDFSAYSRLSLPALEFLKVLVPPRRESETNEPFNHLYKSWSLPSLHRLHGVNILPILSRVVFGQISSFHFEVERSTHPSQIQTTWSLHILSSYLCLFPYVEYLKVDIDCQSPYFDPYFEGPRVRNLRNISFKLHNYNFAKIESLFGIFDYESVVSLSVNVCDGILPYLPKLFTGVWRRDRFRELKKLDFRLIPRSHALSSQDHSYIFSRTLILQHFLGGQGCAMQSVYLESAGDDERQLFGSSNRLAAIQLKNCQLISDDYKDKESEGADFIHDLEALLMERWKSTSELLVLDGEKGSPLDDAEVEKINI